MTSSLVGSEMCIRDRNTANPSVESQPHHAGMKGFSARNRLMAADAWPVSYTHLTLPTICSV
eukprot:9188587-Prorocentrum_lima.AAC.1